MLRAWRGTVLLSVLGVLVLFACVFGLVSPAGAAVIEPLSLEQMSDRAQTIVYTRTVETTSRYATGESIWGEGIIETVVKLQVLDTLKGETQKQMTLVVPGGTVGDLTFQLDYAPIFTSGDTDLLFLDDEGEVLHGSVGALRVVDDQVVELKTSLSEVRRTIEGDKQDLGVLTDLRPSAKDSGFTKQATTMQVSETLTGKA